MTKELRPEDVFDVEDLRALGCDDKDINDLLEAHKRVESKKIKDMDELQDFLGHRFDTQILQDTFFPD